MQRVEFTKEVISAIDTLKRKTEHFQISLNEVEASIGANGLRQSQLLAELQSASDCEQALDQLRLALGCEEKKHEQAKIGLKSSYNAKVNGLDKDHKKKLASLQNEKAQRQSKNKSQAVSQASTVISEVSSLKDLAEAVNVSILSISQLSPEDAINTSRGVTSGPSGYRRALSDAGNIKSEYKKETFSFYKLTAGWTAGAGAVFAWLTGATFGAGLLIGLLLAVGVFVVFYFKKSNVENSIGRLLTEAETEIANIRKLWTEDEVEAQRELADNTGKANEEHSENRALMEREHIDNCQREDDRYRLIKERFFEEFNTADDRLFLLADKLRGLAAMWEEQNKFLFDRRKYDHSRQKSDGYSQREVTHLTLLGSAGLSTKARKKDGNASRLHVQ